MKIEFGNHSPFNPLDDAPCVTTVQIPEADSEGLGGYSHKVGALSVTDFRLHRQEALDFRDGITQLPDHEALLAIINAWPTQASGRPAWVNAVADDQTPEGVAEDIEAFLAEHYGCDAGKPADVELKYHTRYGPPGEGSPTIPDITNLYTNDGRVMNNLNDGGGQVGLIGAGTAASATTLTTASTLVTNAWTGYRVICYSTTSNNLVWANVITNTNAAGASVLTVDQWYTFASPGGAAGTTPTTPWAFVLVDGGMVSSWFAALATGVNAPAVADHTLATNGNIEYVQAGGTLIRKICPTATTSGVATRTVTLVPVFTVNATDVANMPKTFTTIGFFTSMVVSFGGAGGPMKFETALNASATVAALNDQITVTEVITGS